MSVETAMRHRCSRTQYQVRDSDGANLRKEEHPPKAERSSVKSENEEKSFPPVHFACPRCGASVTVRQSQGDRCPDCSFEFKWFLPHEDEMAHDYHSVLTGEKYLVRLAGGEGWIVAHV